MNRVLSLSLLINLFCYSQQQGKSVQELIAEIYKKNESTTNAPLPQPLPGVNNCQCVPYYLCDSDSRINTNGLGLIDIRVDEGVCESYLDFCCNHPDVRQKPITPAPVIKEGCGRRNVDGVGFRIQGDKDNEANFGEFPWMVAILREEPIEGDSQNLLVYQCGGALIHPRVVITAAHCVSAKEKTFRIRAGEWDTQTTKEIFPHQDRRVKSVTIHPEYYAGALFNDIAFLTVESPFELMENVDTLCLPTQNAIFPANTLCYATGWGKDTFGKGGKYQVILKKITLPLVERNICENSLRTTRLGRFFKLDESFICAGGEPGKDTCKGDGGSPLVCPIPGQTERYQHVGIVAWGIGCGESQIPGVYVNVAKFRDWINGEMSRNHLGTDTYTY